MLLDQHPRSLLIQVSILLLQGMVRSEHFIQLAPVPILLLLGLLVACFIVVGNSGSKLALESEQVGRTLHVEQLVSLHFLQQLLVRDGRVHIVRAV